MTRCPNCSGRDWKEVETELELELCGRKFKLVGPARRCSDCGEELFEASVMGMFDLAIASDLARQGPPTGEAFRFMRRAIGMPAAELSELLDVAPETVSRWENGKLPVERRALALLASLVLDQAEGRSSTLDRLRALREPSRPPKLTRLKLNPVG